ncbi:hypothetical protein EMIT0P176_80080 [Pseudomonas sp. IT-P176]
MIFTSCKDVAEKESRIKCYQLNVECKTSRSASGQKWVLGIGLEDFSCCIDRQCNAGPSRKPINPISDYAFGNLAVLLVVGGVVLA